MNPKNCGGPQSVKVWKDYTNVWIIYLLNYILISDSQPGSAELKNEAILTFKGVPQKECDGLRGSARFFWGPKGFIKSEQINVDNFLLSNLFSN